MTKMFNTNDLTGRKIDMDFGKQKDMSIFLQRRRSRAERRVRRAL